MSCYLRYLSNTKRIFGLNQNNIKLLRSAQVVHCLNIPCRSLGKANSSYERHDVLREGNYFVALREIPVESPDSNEALRIPREGDRPTDFTKIDCEKCYLALGKAMGEFDTLIDNINYVDESDDILKDAKKLFLCIEDGLYKLDSVYQIINLMWHVSYEHFHLLYHKEWPKIFYKIRRKHYESDKIHLAIQKIAKESGSYERSVQKMLEMYIQESKRSDSNPEDKGSLDQLESHLNACLAFIHDTYYRAVASFTLTIDDPDILKSVSPEISTYDSTHHKSRTPLRVNLNNSQLFLRLCPDSEQRRSFFRTLNRLCSPVGNPKFNIYREFENVRLGRRKIADSLKARNYFELRRKNAGVQSKDLILKTLSKLNKTNMTLFKNRLNELSDYASNLKDDNYDGEIQEADLQYWVHKYKQDILLGCNGKDLESCFSADKVFQGLVDFLGGYFDIHVKQLKLDESFVWNKDVALYNVSYKDQDIGTFYYDPYTKVDRQVANPVQGRIRGRSDLIGCKASLYLSHRMRKNASGVNFMSQIDIRNLFYGIGMILQELLCDERFYELNIRGPFKPDIAKIIPNLFVTWLYKDPRILQSCSHNQDDGKHLSLDRVKKILKYMTHFNCINNADELYKSHLDIELNSSIVEASKIAPKLYSIYKPFSYDTTTYHYCSDLSLIAGSCAIYYGNIWSKVIATECFDIYQVPKEVSLAHTDIIKQTSERIITSIFDTNEDADLMDRLAGITGNGFNFSQPSLGVL